MIKFGQKIAAKITVTWNQEKSLSRGVSHGFHSLIVSVDQGAAGYIKYAINLLVK